MRVKLSFKFGELSVNRLKAYDIDHGHCASAEEKKQAALRYIMEAWEEAVYDGIEPELLANAAFFAALSDLVSSYGEDAVARMTEGCPGAFTMENLPYIGSPNRPSFCPRKLGKILGGTEAPAA